MISKQYHMQEGKLVEFPSSHKNIHGHMEWLKENLAVLKQNPIRYKTAITNCERRIKKVQSIMDIDAKI